MRRLHRTPAIGRPQYPIGCYPLGKPFRPAPGRRALPSKPRPATHEYSVRVSEAASCRQAAGQVGVPNGDHDRRPAAARAISLSGLRVGPRPDRDLPQSRLIRGVPARPSSRSSAAGATSSRQSRSGFLARELEDLLDWSRSEIGAFVGADADDLALMPERHGRHQHRPALARVREGRRAARDRPRLQRQPERPALRRRSCRSHGRAGALPVPDLERGRGLRGDHGRSHAEHQAGDDRPRDQPDGADPADRAARAGAGREGRRRSRRRGPRAGHDPTASARARPRLLRRHDPQVDVRPEGHGLPVRPARPAGDDQAAGHLARRERPAGGPIAVPPRVRLDRHASTRAACSRSRPL